MTYVSSMSATCNKLILKDCPQVRFLPGAPFSCCDASGLTWGGKVPGPHDNVLGICEE